MKGPKDLLYIYFVRPNLINLGHEERGLFSPLQRKTNKKFHKKKKSIHTCNQHTRMNTPHSVRLAQMLKAKKKEKGDISRQKSTHTHVCATQLKRVHTYHSKRKKKVYKMEPIDFLFIHFHLLLIMKRRRS